MLKLFIFGILFSVVVCQNPQLMQLMMRQMFAGNNGGGENGFNAAHGMFGGLNGGGENGGHGTSGLFGSLNGGATGASPFAMARQASPLLNNPAFLCRNSKSASLLINCSRNNMLCERVSFTEHQLPGLLKCSPMGFGCCFKDYNSYMMAQRQAGEA